MYNTQLYKTRLHNNMSKSNKCVIKCYEILRFYINVVFNIELYNTMPYDMDLSNTLLYKVILYYAKCWIPNMWYLGYCANIWKLWIWGKIKQNTMTQEEVSDAFS